MEIHSALPSVCSTPCYTTISLDAAATGNLRGWGRLCPLLTPAARPQHFVPSLSPQPNISQCPYFLTFFSSFCCRGAGSLSAAFPAFFFFFGVPLWELSSGWLRRDRGPASAGSTCLGTLSGIALPRYNLNQGLQNPLVLKLGLLPLSLF